MKKTVNARKILSLVLTMLFILSLAACGAAPDPEWGEGLGGNKEDVDMNPAPEAGEEATQEEAKDESESLARGLGMVGVRPSPRPRRRQP